MRTHALALLSAATLLLTSATPPAPSIQALIECRVSREEALVALDGLTVLSTVDHSVAPDRNIRRTYHQPDDLRVYGFSARSFSATDLREQGMQNLSILAIVAAPYDQAVTAGLKAHGLTKCQTRPSGASPVGSRDCIAIISRKDGLMTTLVFKEHRSETALGCAYLRQD